MVGRFLLVERFLIGREVILVDGDLYRRRGFLLVERFFYWYRNFLLGEGFVLLLVERFSICREVFYF